jgi:hypothetical protein
MSPFLSKSLSPLPGRFSEYWSSWVKKHDPNYDAPQGMWSSSPRPLPSTLAPCLQNCATAIISTILTDIASSLQANNESNIRNLKLSGHVGFDSLPDQLVNKSVQSGFIFNILCIGEKSNDIIILN